jgi:hypothetical protein
MASIQFDEEPQYPQREQPADTSPFIRLVLATGVVSTKKQAEYVLLGSAAFMVILAFILPLFMSGSQIHIPKNVPQKLTLPGSQN